MTQKNNLQFRSTQTGSGASPLSSYPLDNRASESHPITHAKSN